MCTPCCQVGAFKLGVCCAACNTVMHVLLLMFCFSFKTHRAPAAPHPGPLASAGDADAGGGPAQGGRGHAAVRRGGSMDVDVSHIF